MKIVNATALLVSWDALNASYLHYYTIYYSAKKLDIVFDG